MPVISRSSLLRSFGVFVIALITCACAPQGNVRDTPSPPPDPEAAARRQLETGNVAAAATAYGALAADADAASAARYRALAALAHQDAGDTAAAAELLAALGPPAPGATALSLAHARALLEAGQAEAAYQTLQPLAPAALSTAYLRGVQARTRGAAALATGRHAEAAAAYVEAWRYPYPPARAEALAHATWQSLSRLPRAELEASAAAAEGVAAGWYQLATVALRTMVDTAALTAETAAWRDRHPGHPAAVLIETLLERSAALGARPAKVAVLLPFDDTLGAASRAIRDGLITAWYGDADAPELAIYSSADGTLEAQVERALAEGAEFIVGPLRKPLVETLQRDAELAVGVLALNVADTPAPARPNFYQFGLTPEDEARQVARRAFASGKRALLLAPDTDWGQRLMAAYDEAWTALGGEVLARVRFAERAEAYADAVKRALNVDLSEARAAALRQHLNLPLHTAQRRRADADLILLAAFPDDARQVMPQLRYFGAGGLPVFATSHVYAGRTDTGRDVDLNGLVFGDMPWLFGLVDRDSYTLVQRYWDTHAASFARLYAFGIDAWRMLPYLAKMRYQPGLRVPGVTGELSMDARGVVQRAMSWLRFVDGRPQPVDEFPTAAAH